MWNYNQNIMHSHLLPFFPPSESSVETEALGLKIFSSKAMRELKSQKMKDFFLSDLPSKILG